MGAGGAKPALAFAAAFLYKPGFRRAASRPPSDTRSYHHGRPETKNIAVETWDAPLGRCAQGADLRRGQGFRRVAPPAPHRPQDRHVSRAPGAQAEERSLTRLALREWSPPGPGFATPPGDFSLLSSCPRLCPPPRAPHGGRSTSPVEG